MGRKNNLALVINPLTSVKHVLHYIMLNTVNCFIDTYLADANNFFFFFLLTAA